MKTKVLARMGWSAMIGVGMMLCTSACSSDEPNNPPTPDPEEEEVVVPEDVANRNYSVPGTFYSDVYVNGTMQLKGFIPKGIQVNHGNPWFDVSDLGHKEVTMSIKGFGVKLEGISYTKIDGQQTKGEVTVTKEESDNVEFTFAPFADASDAEATITWTENGNECSLYVSNEIVWLGGRMYDFEESLIREDGLKMDKTFITLMSRCDAAGAAFTFTSDLANFEFNGEMLVKNLAIWRVMAYEYKGALYGEELPEDAFEVDVNAAKDGEVVTFAIPADNVPVVYRVYYSMDVRQLNGSMKKSGYIGWITICQNFTDEEYESARRSYDQYD